MANELTTRMLKTVIFISVGIVSCSNISHGINTFPWTPQGWNGFEMYCPNNCKNAYTGGTTIDSCCACSAKSVWDFHESFASVNISSDNCIEGNVSARNIHVLFAHKYLKSFPINLCDFHGITRIYFSSNLITEIPNLSCLPNLTHLDLSRNKISAVPKMSLIENRNLRMIDLSNNFITGLEAGALGQWSAHYMLLSGNLLMTIDITNIIFKRPFCEINVSNNSLMIPTNRNYWKMNLNTTIKYGPGFVNISYNDIKRIFSATDMGISNIVSLGKLFDFGFDFRHNPIICDCKIAELLLHLKSYIYMMTRDYFYITCGSPEQFRGRTLPAIIKTNQIKDLLCNYTSTSLCPIHCSCVERPRNISYQKASLNLVLSVNCTGVGLRRLPRALPYSKNIEFYMRGNKIQKIPKSHYLNSITVLELDAIPVFENGVLINLTNIEEFSISRAAQFRGIPRALAFLSPCVFLHKGDFVMNCTCAHLWMLDWILTFSPLRCTDYSFKCLNGGGEENLDSYLSSLDCKNTKDFYRILLLITCLSLVLFSFIAVMFIRVWKYELKIILRSRKLCTPKVETLDKDCVVYILYESENKDIDSWVTKTLEPFLASKGLSTFIPYRDLPLGGARIEEAACQINLSRFYIVLLSFEFFNEESFKTLGDWRNIWNCYISDSRKKLLVINFDLIRSTEISCRKLRAFMRFGNVADFSKGESKTFATVNETFFS